MLIRSGTLSAVIVAAAIAMPSAASAQSESMCSGLTHPRADPSWQTTLLPQIGDISGAASYALGKQLSLTWLDNTLSPGVAVAMTPGPLDRDAAAAAIRARLPAIMPPEQVALASSMLHVYETPYDYRELRELQPDVVDEVVALGLKAWTVGVGCDPATGPDTFDAWRVVVEVWSRGDQSVPSQEQARVRAGLARFGDRVNVRFRLGGGPQPNTGSSAPLEPTPQPESAAPAPKAKAPRVAQYATWPKLSRCVRGRSITIKAAARPELHTVTVRARRRPATRLLPGRRTRVTLTARTTRVTLTATLRDGREATRVLEFRRCGRTA